MEMCELNDLLPESQWEDYWTILGDQHEELADDKEYVIFEHYCVNPTCDCKSLVAEIQEIGSNHKATGKSVAMIEYDWSSNTTRCDPVLLDESPKDQIALDLLTVYKKHIHNDEYLSRIKNQYAKIKAFALQKQPARNTKKNTGRNDPCPCGSNKKYKKCCLNQ